ncbi:MAG: UDP-N-acetylglucosamine 2-epimerase (non-hydrolyzing) [Methanomassiliicoccales archaeon]
MRIATVVGARPQFVKCAPLSKEIRKKDHEILIHTGQHYDYEMSKVFFDELQIPEPDYNLNVGSGSHGEQTGRALEAIEKTLIEVKPKLVIVYGDTNSTLAGALAAAKLNIPVCHVEAGLRSYDRKMPEEINRVLTDHVSSVLFAPTERAVENLSKEGIRKGVYRVGDVMVDSLAMAKKAAAAPSPMIESLNLEKGKYIAMTMHRSQNTDNPQNLRRIISALSRIEERVIFPVHPRTRKALQTEGLIHNLPGNLSLIDPLGYVDMIRLMSNARVILTDSGGIQKESYLLGVRCVTMRDTTEWPETLRGGMNILVGSDPEKIIKALSKDFKVKKFKGNPFGTPGASKRIVSRLRRLSF